MIKIGNRSIQHEKKTTHAKATTYNVPYEKGFPQSVAVKHLTAFLRLNETHLSQEHPNGKNEKT